MPPKDVERMANSVNPDLIRIYTVCSDIHVPIFKIFTVGFVLYQCLDRQDTLSRRIFTIIIGQKSLEQTM